jgi:hypothetical protein
MPFSRVVVISLLCFAAASAQAQLRTIPGEAKGGAIRHMQETIVLIDGVQMRLAPGVQIRDEWNRLMVPTALPPGAKVRYLLDSEGQVRQVWILSPQEAAQKLQTTK